MNGTIIAADCGRKSGWILIIRPDGDLRLVSMNASFDEEQVLDDLVFDALEGCPFPVVAFVERPPGSRFTGRGAGKTSMLQDPSLMTNFGAIMGALRALRIPTQSMPPQTWQKSFGIKGDEKHVAESLAVQLFQARTGKTIDKGNADVFLIAEFGRRIAAGEKLVKSWRQFPADWRFSKLVKILS